MKIVRNDDDEKLAASRVEYDLIKDLKHPNIVSTIEFFEDTNRKTTYIVMELCEGHEL